MFRLPQRKGFDMSEIQKAMPEEYWGEWYNPKEGVMTQKQREELKAAKAEMLKKYISPTDHDKIKVFGDARFMDGFEQGFITAKGWK